MILARYRYRLRGSSHGWTYMPGVFSNTKEGHANHIVRLGAGTKFVYVWEPA